MISLEETKTQKSLKGGQEDKRNTRIDRATHRTKLNSPGALGFKMEINKAVLIFSESCRSTTRNNILKVPKFPPCAFFVISKIQNSSLCYVNVMFCIKVYKNNSKWDKTTKLSTSIVCNNYLNFNVGPIFWKINFCCASPFLYFLCFFVMFSFFFETFSLIDYFVYQYVYDEHSYQSWLTR